MLNPRVDRPGPRPSRRAPGRRNHGRRRRTLRDGPATAGSRTARPRPARRWAGSGSGTARQQVGPIAHDRDLGDSGAAACRPRPAGVRRLSGRPATTRTDQLQDLVGLVAVALLAGQRGEAEQAGRRHRVGRRAWRCPAGPSGGRSSASRVVGGGEEAAVVGVPELVEHRVGDRPGLVDPAASPVASARATKASTRAAWSAASASWRARAVGLPRAPPAAVGAAQVASAGTRRWRAAASSQSSRPSAAPASARAASMRAFHSVRTLSSSPGRTPLGARRRTAAARARSTSGGRSRSPRTGAVRIVRPSKLPASVTPYHSSAARRARRRRGVDLRRRPEVEPALLALAGESASSAE